MYNRIRQVHLFAAFILTVFVLMYFVTGCVMIFEQTFERKDNAVVTVVKHIPGIRRQSGDGLISELRKNFVLGGQYQMRKNGERTLVDFRHPGTEVNVVFPAHSDSVTVTTKKKNIVGIMHQFHRLHGYHGGGIYKAWALAYDLSAFSMILFAFTGVYLWYKTERNKWPGWLILSGFTLFTTFTLIYLNYLR